MRITILTVLACSPVLLHAQVPGTRLNVDVTVSSVVLRGDTTRVSYVLRNRPESQDSLLTFIVDAPARVSYIARPQPDSLWTVDSLVRGNRPAALWEFLNLLAPSASTGPIFFESVGLPDIVSQWAGGDWPLPTCCDDDAPGTGEDAFVTRTVQGRTVGVEQWPGNRSSQALLARLRSLTQESCATPLLWVSDGTLCAQLVTDLDAAESYRATGATAQARSAMDHFKGLLAGPAPGTFATGVTSAAYWLLKSNADIVMIVL